ncbi:MAG: DUF177 domain-containing protein [Pseudomonadota bacterium]
MKHLPNDATILPIEALSRNRHHSFLILLGQEDCHALADSLGLLGLKKLRFEGTITPVESKDWLLEGKLGATVVQSCVVTLEPVTTRLEEFVSRRFIESIEETYTAGEESAMPDDDSVDVLGNVINLIDVLSEALSLALPAYPRKPGLEFSEALAAPPGVKPLSDEDTKPFAGLAQLREKLKPDDAE